MKKRGEVMEALMMVFQFGLNMLVPIFLCTGIGVWIGNKTGITWITIPLFFVGALAGFTSVYKMSKKLIGKDKEHAKKNQ